MRLQLLMFRFALIGAFSTGVSGCGSLTIHNDIRAKQGIEAKESWSKVDLGEVIAVERANLGKLLETELATQDKLALAIRDHTLRSIVDAKNFDEAVFKRIKEKLAEIVGQNGRVNIAEAITAQSEQKRWVVTFSDAQKEWSRLRLTVNPPVCADFPKKESPESKKQASEFETALRSDNSDGPAIAKQKAIGILVLDTLKRACKDEPASGPYDKFEGSLKLAKLRYVTDKQQLALVKKEAGVLASAYNKAVKEYADAMGTDGSSTTEKLLAALAELKKAVEALEKAPDALSKQFLSQERLSSLNAFVDAVTQAGTDGKLPDGANKATVAFVLFPKLIDDAKKSLADAKAPLALPLLIQRNHEQLQLEAATREVAAREALERILAALVDATFQQAVQLDSALTQFSSIRGLEAIKGKAVSDVFASTSQVDKVSLYRGMAYYLDALNRLDARRYKFQYQYIAVQHELQLVYAEVNAKQWASLIGSTVDQVAAASASGIKADSVVALLNSFGVLAVARGVNK